MAFGANRGAPQTVTVPDEYAGSFINSSEEEVVPGIGKALILLGVDQGLIKAGTLITVKFSDGTTAQYVKTSAGSSYQWTWTGTAHDKNGKLMRRDGSLVSNPNTAGTGNGTFSGPGFGPGAIDWFTLTGGNFCTSGGQIEFTDGTVLGGWEWGPC